MQPLMGVMSTGDEEARIAAVAALGKLGEPAVEQLIASLKDGNPVVRARSATWLGGIRDPHAPWNH